MRAAATRMIGLALGRTLPSLPLLCLNRERTRAWPRHSLPRMKCRHYLGAYITRRYYDTGFRHYSARIIALLFFTQATHAFSLLTPLRRLAAAGKMNGVARPVAAQSAPSLPHESIDGSILSLAENTARPDAIRADICLQHATP